MKGVIIVVLMVLMFAGGVWASQNYRSGAVDRISDVVDSVSSSGISSVDAAWTELREIEESSNREVQQLKDWLDDTIFVTENGMGRVCDVSRSLIRDDKRMVELMRFINENAPSSAPVTVTLTTADGVPSVSTIIFATAGLRSAPSLQQAAGNRGIKTWTADELEDAIAGREWDLDDVC